jgi:hypothetical protein
MSLGLLVVNMLFIRAADYTLWTTVKTVVDEKTNLQWTLVYDINI